MLSRRLLNCGCRNGNCEMKVCILNVLTLRILAELTPARLELTCFKDLESLLWPWAGFRFFLRKRGFSNPQWRVNIDYLVCVPNFLRRPFVVWKNRVFSVRLNRTEIETSSLLLPGCFLGFSGSGKNRQILRVKMFRGL